jgi:hypothetical protein
MGDQGSWPKPKELPARGVLSTVYDGGTLPTRADPIWNFLGTSDIEEEVARVLPGGLRIQGKDKTPARWSNEKLEGLNQVDLSGGVSADIEVRVLRSSTRGGVNLELFVRGGALTVNHYLLTITATRVYYWYRGELVPVATGLNNSARAHTYRLAVRPDTAVQIYRDGRALSVQPADVIIDWRAPARGSYLEWGTSDSGSSAVVKRVSFDTGGAYRAGS